jgi:hypothetical protein
MIEGIMSDPESMIYTASNLINNTVSPKEFHIIYNGSSQHGMQDSIVAYQNNIYYVNSMNDYDPHSNTSGTYGTSWAIINSIYDPVATSLNQVSNGIRKNMVLKSNKLLYIMRYEGMGNDEVSYLENESLLYLNTVSIGDT